MSAGRTVATETEVAPISSVSNVIVSGPGFVFAVVIAKRKVPQTFASPVSITIKLSHFASLGTGLENSDVPPALSCNAVRLINPFYDASHVYIPRDKRKEWCPVGLLGKVRLRDGCPTNPNWRFLKTIEGKELWLIR